MEKSKVNQLRMLCFISLIIIASLTSSSGFGLKLFSLSKVLKDAPAPPPDTRSVAATAPLATSPASSAGKAVSAPAPEVKMLREQLSSTLVGHWKMDEGSGDILTDHSGNGNHAIIQKSKGVSWVAGVDGLALKLPGTTDRFATAPNQASLNITDAITLAAWMQPSEVSTRTILSKAAPDGYELGVNDDGKLEFRFNYDTNGNTYSLESNTSYTANGSTWTHVAATFDGTTSTIYINGVADASVTYNTPVTIRTNTSALYIGSLDGSRRWKGGLDDVRLYNGALTALQVYTLIQGEPSVPETPVLSSPANFATGLPLSLNLNWEMAAGAGSYQVQVAQTPDFSSTVADVAGLQNSSFQVNDLEPDVQYYWRVKAKNQVGETEWSAGWTFTTASASLSSSGITGNILVGHWKMNEGSGETLLDNSGYENHATIKKSRDVTWVAGVDGLALNLPGTKDRFATAPSHASLGITDAITIAAWMRPLDFSTRTILSKSDPDGYEFGINNDGKLEFRFNYDTNGNTYSLESNTSYTANGSTWTHVAATFDGTTSTIYINGVADASVTYNTPVTIRTNTSALYIGSLDGSRRWKGGLDDVRLYNGALSAAEIDRVMRIAPEPEPPVVPVLASPVDLAEDVETDPVLSWNTSNGAATYNVQVSEYLNFSTTVFDQGSLTTTSVQVTGLQEGKQYYWRVHAGNDGGDSDWSEVWSFTTTSSTPPPPPVTDVTLFHYWNFNNTSDLLAPTQTLNSGSLTAALTTASAILADDGQDFSGINARNGDLAETHLRLNTPIGSVLTFNVSTIGFENIVLKYETRRSGSGAGLQKVSYSLDGTTFVPLQDVTVVDGIPELVTLDFSSIAGANDNANFKVQLEFEQGLGGTAGNNRFDNLTVEGDALGAVNLPPVVSNAVGLQELVAGAAATEIDLSTVFSDPENDALTFTASSSNTAVATVAIAGNMLQVTPLKAGDAAIELKANDGNLDSAPASFRVLVYPAAQALSAGAFAFGSWDANEPEGSFPGNMLFLQSDVDDPGVDVPLLFPYAIPAADYNTADLGNIGFPYRNTSRTRINGLGENGISFINTGRGRDLGAALVAVDTRDITGAKISFNAETLLPNFRVYNLAVFYRVGSSGAWSPVFNQSETPLVYESKEVAENSLELLTGYLPAAAVGQQYVQVLFRYYFTGVQRDGGGARTQLRLDNIDILEDSRTSVLLPGQVVTLAPTDNQQDVILKPEFSWEETANASTYNVQVATDDQFTSLVVDEVVSGQTTYKPETALAVATDYFWRVMAVNSAGDGPWSDVKTFRTVLQATVYNLAINEVMSSNSNTIADEDGAFEDWIELVNYGTTPVDLEGFGLSDSYDNPFKWVFPAKTIAPGEFLLIWASSKNKVNPALPLHTSFAISAQGEEVLLTSPDGNLVDEMPPVAIASGLSSGRQPDGTGAFKFFDVPTPGASNQEGGYSELVAKAAFSVAPGVYPSTVSLAITHPDPAVIIRYTLDGSEPTAASPIYEQPLQIVDRSGEPNAHSLIPTNFIEGSSRSWNEPTGLVRKGTVVRAKAFKENTLNSEITTGTYIVLPGRQYTMPVVSVVSPFENLFGHETGIYVPGATYVDGDENTGNYNQLGDAWERPGSIELFAPEVSFQENVGLRINGDYTRRFPQKSLRIVARGEYGNSYMNYPVFQNYPYSSFKRLVLRNSGNDWGTTMFKDAAAQYLVKHIMPTQNFRPAVVFINGEYWGVHNIRERADKHYLGRIYGVDPDNIDLLTYDYVINEGDDLHYKEMLNYIGKTDLSSDANFEGVKTRMDVDNYLDYFSAQIYYGNDDWPHSNIDFWRARVPYDPNAPAGQDGRWRWILYDTDRAFGANSGGDPSFNSVAWVISKVNGDINEEWPNFIMYHLLQNANFKHDFINRIADQLNTAFVAERVQHVVDSIRVIMEPEMEEHILRWGRPSSVSSWGKNVVDMKNFASVRPGYVRQHLRDAFGLGAEIAVNLNVSDESHGSVMINSLTINSKTVGANAQQPYPWQGTYFAGVPIQLKALASEGYVFDYWLVDGQVYNQEELSLTPAANVTAVAFFVPSTGIKPTLAAPVNAAIDVAIAPTVFSWNSLPDATSYRLQVATVPDFATTVFDQSNIAATSAEVPDLVNNVLYYWRVMAVGNNGSSDWSATWSFRTETVLLPLPAVATLSAPANTATAVSLNPILTWNAATNATFYNVQVSTASDFTTLMVNQGNIAATSLKVTGLALNQTYFWRVQSENETGNANWSNTWSFTTLAEGSSSVLVGHWKMDEGSGETLLDNSGAGNHATLQKTKDVSWTAGVDGLALYLPGATDRFATVPSNATLNIFDAITIAAWIRPVDVSTRTILSKTGADGYDFGVNNDGKLEFRINDDTSDGAYRIESSTSYPSNGSTWMHVAATFDGSTSKIYINGVEDAAVTYGAPVSILGNTSPLYIGSQLTSRKWRGDLDDVRLYHGALNASEVMGLLNPVSNNFRLNPTSLSQDQQMEINVYPNPVAESVFLNFRNANTAIVTIRITDVLGRKYLESDFALEGEQLEVNLSEAKMGSGVYFLVIQSKGYNKILKIIKK